MNKQFKKERTDFWHGWFNSCKENGTCSIQNVIYNREKEMVDYISVTQGFYQYASIGKGDAGNKGFRLK